MRIVRSHGLTPLSRPVRRGAYYEVIAGTRSGGQMRVVVDAFAGDILKLNPILAGGPNGPRLAAPYDPALPPRPVAPYDPNSRLVAPYESTVPPPVDPRIAAAPPGRFDDSVPALPPRNVPGARIANTPDATSALSPPRTPIPRPRPQVADAQIEPPTLAGAPAPQPEAEPKPAVARPAAARKPAPAPVPPGEAKMIPVAPLE